MSDMNYEDGNQSKKLLVNKALVTKWNTILCFYTNFILAYCRGESAPRLPNQ